VGAKMIVTYWRHVPTVLSLGVIVATLTIAIVASVVHDRKH